MIQAKFNWDGSALPQTPKPEEPFNPWSGLKHKEPEQAQAMPGPLDELTADAYDEAFEELNAIYTNMDNSQYKRDRAFRQATKLTENFRLERFGESPLMEVKGSMELETGRMPGAQLNKTDKDYSRGYSSTGYSVVTHKPGVDPQFNTPAGEIKNKGAKR